MGARLVKLACYTRPIGEERMSRDRRGNRARKRLTDQEILEWFLRLTSTPCSLAEGRKGVWKAAIIGSLFTGPFLTLTPFMTWFETSLFRYLWIPIGINAVLLAVWAISFHLASKSLDSNQQERWIHFMGFGSILGAIWMGCYGSLMALLASIGSLIRVQGAPWWLPILIYGISGIGLWLGRRAILRAIVEGPEAHSWFWPIRLLFAVSLGFCIFLAALFRIFVNWLEQLNVSVALLLLTALLIGVSILFLGLAMIGGIISYLHYQRWCGIKELKI